MKEEREKSSANMCRLVKETRYNFGMERELGEGEERKLGERERERIGGERKRENWGREKEKKDEREV